MMVIMEKERRIKVLSLLALIVAVLGLTIAFAALSQTLTINGRASMNKSGWDIHFDNLSNASITGEAKEISTPQITDGGITLDNINVSLSKPKDKVEYTVDIVNDGTITAEYVTKEPVAGSNVVLTIEMTKLTEEQSKYLEFYANYSDGRDVSESDILKPKQKETVKIVIGFKEDITGEDLPKEVATIDLSLAINYVQSDENGNGGTDIPTTTTEPVYQTYEVGDEIALGNEHFYVISDNENTVTALARHNITLDNVPVQSDSAKTTTFSSSNYWVKSGNLSSEYGDSYPSFVYDSNSKLYSYVQNYQTYLKNLGYESVLASLLSYEQAVSLGCDANSKSCSNAPNFLTTTKYWLGSAGINTDVYNIKTNGKFEYNLYLTLLTYGIRPVITIDKNEL